MRNENAEKKGTEKFEMESHQEAGRSMEVQIIRQWSSSEKSRESIHGKNHHREGIQGQAMKRETVETTVQWKNRSHEGKRNRRLYYWIQAQTLLCPQSFGCHVHLRVLCFLQNWPYLDPYRVFYSLFYSEIIFYHLPCRNAPLLVSKGFS